MRISERIRLDEIIDQVEHFAEPRVVGQPRQGLSAGGGRGAIAEHLASPGVRGRKAARYRLCAVAGTLAAVPVVAVHAVVRVGRRDMDR